MQGHHLSDTACVLGRGTAMMAPCFPASGLTPWLLLGSGWPCLSPLCQAGDRRVVSVLQLWLRVSPASPRMTAGAEPAKAPAGLGTGDTPICAEAGRGWRVDGIMTLPSEPWDVGALQDGGGHHTAPDSDQRFAFGSPAS